MFPPPWAHDSGFPALSSLFGPRSRHRPSVSHSFRPDPYDMYPKRGSKQTYDKPHKTSSFPELDTPPGSDFASDFDDPYTLDTDSSIFPKHHSPTPSSPRRRSPARKSHPDLRRVSLALPSASASDLRSSDVLVLPPLVHLHVRIHNGSTRTPSIRATVPGCMAFGDVIKQIVHSYVDDSVRSRDVTARVEQRGRMKELAPSSMMEDLAHRGEVLRDGRREMRVEIVVGEDEEKVRVRGRYEGRGPWGGAEELEMVREREVSRTKVAHV